MIQGFGIGVPGPNGETDMQWSKSVVSILRPKFWYDWRYEQIGVPGYVPMIWKMDAAAIAKAAEVANRQSASAPLWFLGNEPEIASQSDTPYHVAAAACRSFVKLTGSANIQWAGCGTNMSIHMSGMGYSWLDGYLACHGPIPDAWHIHIYGGVGAWKESVLQFRTWMEDNKVIRPIIVSECGDSNDPKALLATISSSINNKEIQAAAWFSAYYPAWNDTGLMNADQQLSSIGAAYIGHTYKTYIPIVMG